VCYHICDRIFYILNLDKREFKVALQDISHLLGFDPSQLDTMLVDLMDVVDINLDGVLSFDEFFECFIGLAPPVGSGTGILIAALHDSKNEDKIKEVFDKYDTDHNGSLDGKEFRNVIRDIAQLLNLEGDLDVIVEELMEVCDANMDKKLQFSEFVECLQGLAQ